MSASMVRTVSAHHDRLAAAVAPLAGRVVTAAEVKAAYAAAYPDRPADVQWVIASDHCSNQTNKGACGSAMTGRALLERVGHGRYRVLPPPDGAAPDVPPAQEPAAAVPPRRAPRAPFPPAPSAAPAPPASAPRVEVTVVSPADRDGRLGRAKLALELAGAAVTLIAGLVALIWGTR